MTVNTWNFYVHLRGLLGKLGSSGWRPAYCWAGGTVVILALLQVFVLGPAVGRYAPEYVMVQLNIATVIMLGALGLRTFEKLQFGAINLQQGAEQTRRLEQQ